MNIYTIILNQVKLKHVILSLSRMMQTIIGSPSQSFLYNANILLNFDYIFEKITTFIHDCTSTVQHGNEDEPGSREDPEMCK